MAGEGDHAAAVMLIGEAPGESEDALGRPFVGRAGEFLDDVLDALGIAREALYITSCVKCRPPDNREPRDDELDTCIGHWLGAQIEAVDPALIVLLGRVALRAVIGETGALADCHGQIRDHAGRRYLLTYHPAAAMRFPDMRRRLTEDFERLLQDQPAIVSA